MDEFAIKDGVLYGKHIKGEAVLPDGITRIGQSAFETCSELTSVVIPNSVTSIGRRAFWMCGLETITIPENVEGFGENAFADCRNLTEVNWNSLVRPTKEMLKNIFEGCPYLEAINYHGKKVYLDSVNLDSIIKETVIPIKKETTLDDIIKNAEDPSL